MFSPEHWEGVMTEWWKLLLLLLAVAAVFTAIFVLIRMRENKNGISRSRTTTKDITYGAICVAMSFALSFIPVFSMPYGGSITIGSILPVMIYCYYFGFRKSLIVTFAYMALQFLQGPYIVSPWSALLDYVVPYLSLSVVGIFSFKRDKYNAMIEANKSPLKAHSGFFIAAAIYFVVRLFSHTLAGVLFYANGIDFMIWSGDLIGGIAWAYSLTYNALFLVPDTIIAVALGVVVLANKAFNAFMTKSVNTKKDAYTPAENN